MLLLPLLDDFYFARLRDDSRIPFACNARFLCNSFFFFNSAPQSCPSRPPRLIRGATSIPCRAPAVTSGSASGATRILDRLVPASDISSLGVELNAGLPPPRGRPFIPSLHLPAPPACGGPSVVDLEAFENARLASRRQTSLVLKRCRCRLDHCKTLTSFLTFPVSRISIWLETRLLSRATHCMGTLP